MKNISILVLGSSGFLGKILYTYLKKYFNTSHTGLNKRRYNLHNYLSFKNLLLQKDFTHIINCVALTNVDECEKKKNKAFNTNVKILKLLLKIKKKNKLKFNLIHFSTDQVYNSNDMKYFNKEYDITRPNINYYTKTKKEAEILCKKYEYKDILILRTNFLGKSNSKKKSFSDWLIGNILKNNRISLAEDSLISPLRTNTISQVIKKIIMRKKFLSGIFNLGSRDGMSKLKIGKIFIDKFNKKFKNYEIKKINEITQTKRPTNMMMNSKKFSRKFNIVLPKLSDELNKLIKEYANKNK